MIVECKSRHTPRNSVPEGFNTGYKKSSNLVSNITGTFRVVNLKLDKVDWAGPGYYDLDFQVDWAGPDSPVQAPRPGDLQLWVPIIADANIVSRLSPANAPKSGNRMTKITFSTYTESFKFSIFMVI